MPCGYLCACFPSTKVERLVDILLRLNFGLGPASLPSKMQQNIEIFPYDWTVFLSTYEYCEVCCPGIKKPHQDAAHFHCITQNIFIGDCKYLWEYQRWSSNHQAHVCVTYFVFCTLCWGLAKAAKGHTVTERSVFVFMIVKCWLQHIFYPCSAKSRQEPVKTRKLGEDM